MQRIITLTTDFGYSDPWAGAMKGVMLSINPELTIVDITHGVSPQDVFGGALALMDAFSFFPKGTIHVAVVDPGVGSRRRPIVVRAGGYYFVGPDNGLLWPAIERLRGWEAAWQVKNKDFFLRPLSTTFHGRDVFAPVAARLSLGVDTATLGPEIKALKKLILPRPVLKGGKLMGEVISVDAFGNLITNITTADLGPFGKRTLAVTVNGTVIKGLTRAYSDVRAREAAALFGSSGRLEVACFRGNAAKQLGARRGSGIEVSS